MIDKYNIDFPKTTREKDKERLINQLWKLIPMRENGEEWEIHLSTLLEEIAGLSKLFKGKLESIILLSKLEGLKSKECDDFMIYRKTVFRCIDLLAAVLSDE